MPNDLINNDPIVARFFFMDIGDEKLVLTGVSGLEIELDVVAYQQTGLKGRQQHVKTVGGQLKADPITITRMAPAVAKSDPLWQWFLAIRTSGMKAVGRAGARRDGSIIMYDSAYDEIARFNFYKAWPSKIATDALDTESNAPMKETITLQIERVERVMS